MKAIFNRTLTSMFKPLSIIIYFFLTIIITILMSISSNYIDISKISIEIQKISVVSTFTLFVFVWITGIALFLFIMALGSGIFSQEESEGTMRILLGKPISREAVIFGKILGIITGSFIYMSVSLIFSVTIYSLILSLDKDVFQALIKVVPRFLLYGLFVIIFFTSITSINSSIFKKRIPSIIILTIFIIITFGVLPIVRSIFTYSGNGYERYKLYIVDTNYHMGNIYSYIMDLDNSVKLSPDSKTGLGTFTGIYIPSREDPDIDNSGYMLNVKKNNYLDSGLTFLVYSLITISAYSVCYIRMKKKDIS